MTKKEAGTLGGLSTYRKYGKMYMQMIGKKGAKRFWELYSLKPVGTAEFAIVRRSDNVIIGYTLGGRL